MIVTVEPVTLILPPSRGLRTPGLHQSSILRSVGLDCGLLRRDEEEDLGLTDFHRVTDPVAVARMCLGLAWEEWYIPTQLPDVVDHPGEYHYDGVYLSPDGESLSVIITPKYDLVIHEVKCTYKSTNTVGNLRTPKELSKNWMWLAQIKCYCKARGTRHAVLHVMFIAGDYKRPIIPIPKRFRFVFTQEELDENWTFVKEYAAYKMRRD